MKKNLFSITSLLNAFFLLLIFSAGGNAQVLQSGSFSHETIFNAEAQINFTPFQVEYTQPVSNFEPDGTQALLYDNGPVFNIAGPPQLSELQTALGMTTYGPNASNTAGYKVADDFTLANDADINSIDFYSYQTSSGNVTTINGVFVQIYNGKPGAGGSVIWGNMSTNILGSAGQTGGFRVLDTAHSNTDRPIQKVTANTAGLSLAAGTYWIEYAFTGTTSSGPWAPPITITGQTTTGNAIQWNGTAYVDITDVGLQGMPFQIYGDETGGGSGDLTCFTPNHDLVATFDGTFFIWETGEVSDNTSIDGWNFNPWANGGSLSFYFSAGSNAVSATAGGLDWLVLGPGDVIGPSSTYGATIGFPSNWSGGADGYLGIKFPCSAPGGECYGYVHMTTTGSTGYPATVVDYCVDLDGNEVTIPEEGGGGGSDCLTTLFASNNGGSPGWAQMFDAGIKGSDISITEISANTSVTSGTSVSVDVYTLEGTYLGNETNPAAWTLSATGTGTAMGQDNPSPITLDTPLNLSANTDYGIAIVLSTAPRYTNGTGSNQHYENDQLTLNLGASISGLFTGTLFPDRIFNGTLCYDYGSGGGEGGPCDEKIVMDCGVTYTADLVPNAGEWVNYTGVSYNYTGSEQVFEFTAPTTGTYVFNTDQGAADADFMVMDACSNTANNVLGSGYWVGSGSETITLTEGTTYYIIADLYEFASGPTTVSISVTCPEGPPPGGDCPIDYDGDFVDGLGNLATGIILAADFPVPSGETWDLGDVKVQLLYETTNVEISFYQDAGGQPGTQIFAPTVVTPFNQEIVGNASGTDVYEVTLDLSSYNISLTGGMYWMGITTTTPSGNSYWHYTDSVNNGTNFFGSLDGYATWEDLAIYGFSVDGAFTICTSDTTPPGDDCEFGIPSFSDLANAYNIEMSNSFRTADDFILTEDFAMDKITIDTNQQEIPNDVIIYIHEDNAGKPGTVLHTLTFAGPDESEIVGSAFGDPIYHMTFNVSPALDFVPGTYWIDPKMSTSSGETVWWGATDQASYGAVPQRSTDDGASWSEDPNGLSMIFTVSGICGDGPPPAGDCEQDFYTTEDPISGAGFSSGNWVANDVIVPGNTQFTMQTMTFETVALSGQPTNFDLEIFEDNGSGGVGNSTGMTYHFDSSNMTFTPNGLLFGVYPQFTVVFNLPDILLQANGSADTRYWLAVTSDLSSTSDFTYWVSYLHSFTPIPDSNPTWQYLASDGVWAQYDSSGPNEGYMKVEGHCETLGTGDLNAFDFAYYPNPVRDVLNITSQKAVKSVEAFNMTGQKVLTANKVVNGQIDVNALSPGVYVFKAVLEGGQVETFKIIKK